MIVLKDWLKRELLYGPHTIERGTPGAPFTIFCCAHNGMHGATCQRYQKRRRMNRVSGSPAAVLPSCPRASLGCRQMQRSREQVSLKARAAESPLPTSLPVRLFLNMHAPALSLYHQSHIVSQPAPPLYLAPMFLPHTFTPSASMICCIFVFIN